jgi:hypothetical protein
MAASLKALYEKLVEDKWRKEAPFSDDIKTANELLFHPFATKGDCEQQLDNWVQGNQPCLFGRIAAATQLVHYCILRHDDFVGKSDEHISQIIRAELVNWKRRSLNPSAYGSTPAHGFMLVAASPKLAFAAPDENLRSFASKLRDLWGCPMTQSSSGPIHWETLYIQNPTDSHFQKFTFGVDFFAAQGDNRWWHDHRCPGGILFTANSVGHMRKYREWYGKRDNQEEWTVQTAMMTIDSAANTPYGKSTELKALDDKGQPFVKDLACPIQKLRPQLVNRDWTRYLGHLHTDHSIRPEFFYGQPEMPTDVAKNTYVQDFAYLYDPRSPDYVKFVSGVPAAADEIWAEIGRPEDWVALRGRAPQTAPRGEKKLAEAGPPEAQEEIKALLAKGRQWLLTEAQMDEIDRRL